MNIIKNQNTGSGEGNSQQLHVGVGKFTVVAINPTAKGLKELFNSEKELDEPEYNKETKDKDDAAQIVIWLKNDVVGLKRYQINVVDKPKVWEKSGKAVWINAHGETRAVACEADLPTSFTTVQVWNNDEKKFVQLLIDGKPVPVKYRKCLQGEDELMTFMKNWIMGNNSDPAHTILLDMKRIFRGKFNEIQDLVGSEYVQEVVLPLYVRRVEKDGDVKYYQGIGEPAPIRIWPKINICLQNQSWDASKDTARVYKAWCGPEYSIVSGQGNAFKPVPLQVYDSAAFLSHTDTTISHSEEGGESSADPLAY